MLVCRQPALTALGAAGMIGMGAMAWWASKLAERGLDREIAASVRVSEHILRTLGLRGMLLLTAASPDWAARRMGLLSAQYAKALARRRSRPRWTMEGSFSIGYAVQFLFYLTAGYLVAKGGLSLGTLVALAALLAYLTGGAQQLAAAAVGLRDGLVRLRRIHKELQTNPARAASPPRPRIGPIRGAFSLRDLVVAHPGGKHGLWGLTATIPAGRITAVLGRSGAGKTTLACVLLRLLEPTAGEARLDGQPLADYAPDQLWQHVGYVPQEAVLFSGSVRENLLLGRKADDAELDRCCRAAAIHDRILAAGGYEADVGQDGSTFSAGERQRLILARALLLRPQVLILDEPTAHLDPDSEQCIEEAIAAEARAGATIILLAHRLPASVAVDHVLLLDEGRLAAEGPFANLKSNEVVSVAENHSRVGQCSETHQNPR